MKKEPKLTRVDYMEDPEVKKHAQKSPEGLAKWIRKATRTQFKKESK